MKRGVLVVLLLITAVATDLRPFLVVGVVALLFGIALLLEAPLRILPALALAGFALVPVKQLPFPGEPGTLSPGLLVTSVWIARHASSRRRRDGNQDIAGAVMLLLAGTIVVTAVLSASRWNSATWALSFIALGLAPIALLRGSDRRTRDLLVLVWIRLGAVLGVWAIVEATVLHRNPILDWAYHTAQPPVLQVWSTYRATTTLGHPLVNALFFSLSSVLCYSEWKRRGGGVALLCLAATIGGLLATSSRGGVLAVIVGVAVYTAVQTLSMNSVRSGRLGMPVVVIALLAAGIFGVAILHRTNSSEGQSSSDFRRTTLTDGVALARRSPLLGVGMGNTDAARKSAATGKFRNVGLENSWVELIVGLGIPGAMLMAFFLARPVAAAARSGDAAAAALVCTYCVMAASFNLLEQNRPAHLLFGLVLGLAYSGIDREAAPGHIPDRDPQFPVNLSRW